MSWWQSLFTSRYMRHLEAEVADLKLQIEKQREQLDKERAQHREDVQRLTAALSPALLKLIQTSVQPGAPIAVMPEAVKPAHKIVKASNQMSASCECGWNVKIETLDESAELQTAIMEHHKSFAQPFKARSTRWTGPNGARARLEAEAAQEVG